MEYLSIYSIRVWFLVETLYDIYESLLALLMGMSILDMTSDC